MAKIRPNLKKNNRGQVTAKLQQLLTDLNANKYRLLIFHAGPGQYGILISSSTPNPTADQNSLSAILDSVLGVG